MKKTTLIWLSSHNDNTPQQKELKYNNQKQKKEGNVAFRGLKY